MNCKRVMVVSRGLKLLRPRLKVPSLNPPAFAVKASSGSSEFAKPGSLSFEYWKRNSLNQFAEIVEVQLEVSVEVLTLLFPVCSSALRVPEFSRFVPVKFCWLKRTQS